MPEPQPRLTGYFAAIALLLAALWGYAAYRLGSLWDCFPEYGFGWFVPLLCGVLLFERWKCRPLPETHPLNGKVWLLFVLGSGLIGLGALGLEVLPAWRLAGWIFAGAIIGVSLLVVLVLGGWIWFRQAAFPLLFFLIAIPWPARFERPLIFQLSHFNAAASAGLANLLGTPCVRHGTLIESGGGMVGVEDACSGIRSIQSTIMVALFLGELFRYGRYRRIVLVLGGLVLAVSCNVVRTTYLIWICDSLGAGAVNQTHDAAGWTILVITLAGLLLLTWWLGRRKNATAIKDQPSGTFIEEPCRPRNPRGVVPALVLVIAGITLTEISIDRWFGPLEHQADAGDHWSFVMPSQRSGFTENPIPEWTRMMLKYDVGKSGEWRDSDGRRWQIYYLDWLPAQNRYRAAEANRQAGSHAPEACMRVQGMILQTNLGTTVLAHKGVELRITAERFLDNGHSFHVLAGYWEAHASSWKNTGRKARPSSSQGLRDVLRGVAERDRGRYEKRVIKIGVWDMNSDVEAQSAMEDCLRATIAF